MRRPPSASMLLKQGEAMPRPYKQHSPFSATFVGATHAAPCIRIDAFETWRGNAPPLQTALSISATFGGRRMRRPPSASMLLKQGEACLAPTNSTSISATFVGATHASPSMRIDAVKEGEAMPRPYETAPARRNFQY